MSKLSLFSQFVSLVLFLLTMCFIQSEAKAGVFIEAIMVFEFEVFPAKDINPYFFTINQVSMDVLIDELESNPLVGKVIFVPRGTKREITEKEFAKKRGLNYYITGQFTPVGGNVIIKARWVNLRHNVQDQEPTFLGKEDLDDFGLVAKKVSRLAKKIVLKLTSKVPLRRVFIWCFKGAEKSRFPHLDSLITLELPYYLSRNLKEGRVKSEKVGGQIRSERLAIEGLTAREYSNECRGKGGKTFDGIKFMISGSIIPEGDQFVVKLLIEDQFTRRSILLSTTVGAKDIQGFPQHLAHYLVEPLMIFWAQEQLQDAGFDSGTIDGILGPQTREALYQYQAKKQLPKTGILDEATRKSLDMG